MRVLSAFTPIYILLTLWLTLPPSAAPSPTRTSLSRARPLLQPPLLPQGVDWRRYSAPRAPKKVKAAGAPKQPKQTPASRKCGECEGCLTEEDCGECNACLDKTKFGGPNVKHQKCIDRRCLNPKPASAAELICPPAAKPPAKPLPAKPAAAAAVKSSGWGVPAIKSSGWGTPHWDGSKPAPLKQPPAAAASPSKQPEQRSAVAERSAAADPPAASSSPGSGLDSWAKSSLAKAAPAPKPLHPPPESCRFAIFEALAVHKTERNDIVKHCGGWRREVSQGKAGWLHLDSIPSACCRLPPAAAAAAA